MKIGTCSWNLADVAARLAPLEDDSVRSEADHALGNRYGRGEAEHLGTRGFRRGDLFLFREAARENDVRNLDPAEHRKMILIGGRNGDEIDRKIVRRQTFELDDLLFENIARRVAAREAAEAARITHGRNQFRLGNPGHRTADNRVLHPEKLTPATHQRSQHRQIVHWLPTLFP